MQKRLQPEHWSADGTYSYMLLEDAFDPADRVVGATKTDFQDLDKNIYFIYSYVDEITA